MALAASIYGIAGLLCAGLTGWSIDGTGYALWLSVIAYLGLRQTLRRSDTGWRLSASYTPETLFIALLATPAVAILVMIGWLVSVALCILGITLVGYALARWKQHHHGPTVRQGVTYAPEGLLVALAIAPLVIALCVDANHNDVIHEVASATDTRSLRIECDCFFDTCSAQAILTQGWIFSYRQPMQIKNLWRCDDPTFQVTWRDHDVVWRYHNTQGRINALW